MRRFSLLAATLLGIGSANATTVNWTDWQSSTSSDASGQITVGANAVDVNINVGSAGFAFVQTSGGTNYWIEHSPAPYTGGSVSNAPPTPDIVALTNGGTKTITFSQAVTDPYIAFVSWNGNAAQFSEPFVKISEGCGYWGCGTFSLGANNTFVGSGEVHGILEFIGTFSTLTFSDSTEGWHGLTIGIGGIAPIPEPTALVILGTGLLGLAMAHRRRRRT